MISFDLKQSTAIINTTRTICGELEAYKRNKKADAGKFEDISKKVAEFIKSNQEFFSKEKQTDILDYLHRIQQKMRGCQSLINRIRSAAVDIQLYMKLPEPVRTDNLKEAYRLSQAAEYFKKSIFSASASDCQLAFEQLVKLTNDQERLTIIKRGFIAADQLSYYPFLSVAPMWIKLLPLDVRTHLAIFIAETHRDSCLRWLSKFIHIFEIDDKSRLAIAKIAATEHCTALAEFMTNYKIPKEEDRVELAVNSGSPACICIENFEISHANRVALATYFAKRCPDTLHDTFKSFELSSSYHFSIAKILASSVKLDMTNFVIVDEHKRLEIAMIQTERDIDHLAKDIKKYNFIDESNRIQVAKYAAKMNGPTLLKHLDSFDIKDRNAYLDIVKIAAAQAPHSDELEWLLKRGKIAVNERIAIAAHMGKQGATIPIRKFEFRDISLQINLMLLALSNTSLSHIQYVYRHFVDSLEKHYKDQTSEILTKFQEQVKEFSGKIEKENEVVGEQIKEWFEIYEFTCKIKKALKKLTEKDLDMQQPYAAQILRYEDPAMRYCFLAALIQFGIPKQSRGEGHGLLIDMLLTPLLQGSGVSDDEGMRIRQILFHKEYDDCVKREKVLKGLYRLLYCEELNAQQKGEILKHIFPEKEKLTAATSSKAVSVPASMQMLEVIISSGNGDLLQTKWQEASEKDVKAASDRSSFLERAINTCFTRILGVNGLKDFGSKYAATFGQARNPMAIMIYAAKLQSLNDKDRYKALRTLKEFATAILDGTYKSWRYKTPPDSHLEYVFRDRLALKDDWQKGESLSLSELYKQSEEEGQVKTAASNALAVQSSVSSTVDVVQYLKERICDFRHLNPQEYKSLDACLRDPSKSKSIMPVLAKALKDCKPPSDDEYDPKVTKMKDAYQMALEFSLIKLFDPAVDPSKKAQDIETHILPKLMKIYGSNAQIVQDLKDLQSRLKTRAQAESIETIDQNYTIHDTDHWEDLLLCGTEVSGSCLRISGDVQYNKCLLAYLADGKNRAIVIKDKSGRIVVRSIMRILWDETDKKPVLFQETRYENPGLPDRVLKAMDLTFIRRARQLQLDLVSCSPGLKKYPHDLRSHNTSAPWEYVDARGKGITDGDFEIDCCYHVKA